MHTEIGLKEEFGELPQLSRCNCGADLNDIDTLRDSLYPVNREQTKFNVICQVHNCGCGRTTYGATAQEAVERWNQGLIDEVND